MTDETFAGRNIASIFAGGDPKQSWAKCGEVFGPGDAIRVASGIAYLAKATDAHVSGIAAEENGMALSEDYAIGDLIPYYKKGQDTDVWLKLAASSPVAPVKENDRLTLSAVDGQMKGKTYTDGAQATDSSINDMGQALEADATHVSDMHIIKANLST